MKVAVWLQIMHFPYMETETDLNLYFNGTQVQMAVACSIATFTGSFAPDSTLIPYHTCSHAHTPSKGLWSKVANHINH